MYTVSSSTCRNFETESPVLVYVHKMMRLFTKKMLLKTISVVCSVVALLILALSITSHQQMQRRFTQLEERETGLLAQRLHRDLGKVLDAIGMTANDWAPWDETYAFIADLDPAFVENNLSPDAFKNLHINFFLLFNPEKACVYNLFYDLFYFVFKMSRIQGQLVRLLTAFLFAAISVNPSSAWAVAASSESKTRLAK